MSQAGELNGKRDGCNQGRKSHNQEWRDGAGQAGISDHAPITAMLEANQHQWQSPGSTASSRRGFLSVSGCREGSGTACSAGPWAVVARGFAVPSIVLTWRRFAVTLRANQRFREASLKGGRHTHEPSYFLAQVGQLLLLTVYP